MYLSLIFWKKIKIKEGKDFEKYATVPSLEGINKNKKAIHHSNFIIPFLLFSKKQKEKSFLSVKWMAFKSIPIDY